MASYDILNIEVEGMKKIIQNMPKVELHLHLDGSIPLQFLYQVLDGTISKKQIREKAVVSQNCHSLTEYLEKFDLPISVMQTKENLEEITYELGKELKKENVIYAEIRFAPFFHTKQGLTLDEVVESVLKGIKRSPVKMGLILCCMRGFSLEKNLQIVELCKKYQNQNVVAFDLAGDESKFPTSLYRTLFERGQKLNLNYTIHAGETAGIESIEEAINFKTKRIGHGVQIQNHYSLLIDNDITLEMCPSSNLHTKVVSSIRNYPLYNLYKNGVKVTINTDNRTVSNTTLTKEYDILQKNFSFTLEDFKKMNIQALQSSFLEDKEKEKYIEIIKRYNS